MQSLKKPSLTSLTRADIDHLCEKYRNDKPKLRRYLRAIFAKRENIHLFGWFINRRYIELETPQFHKEMLAIAADKSISRAAFVAPRGHAKSTTINFTFALWSACYKQHRFCVIISDTYTQAEEFVNALKDEFETNIRLRWLYGDLVGDDWRDGEFVLTTGIKFIAKGSGQKIRGIRHRDTRPDLMLFDDIENDENVQSAEQRAKLYKWFTKAALPALSRDGRAILVGTILHFDSLVNKVAQKKDVFISWITRVYYAITKDSHGRPRALWPEHMSLERLISIRDNPRDPKYIGSITFSQEYQHKPFDEEDAIVQPAWVLWTPTRPAANTVVARAQAVDPAASEKQRSDPTGMVVGELDNDGNVYIFYASDKRLTPKRNAADIKRIYELYEPNAVGVEAGALEIVFRDLLDGVATIPQKPDKDKVRRLLAVSKFFEGGRVYFVQKGKGVQALYDQLMEFPAGTHDDMVDALVYVLRMLLVDGEAADDEAETAGDYNHGQGSEDEDDLDDEDDDDENW